MILLVILNSVSSVDLQHLVNEFVNTNDPTLYLSQLKDEDLPDCISSFLEAVEMVILEEKNAYSSSKIRTSAFCSLTPKDVEEAQESLIQTLETFDKQKEKFRDMILLEYEKRPTKQNFKVKPKK